MGSTDNSEWEHENYRDHPHIHGEHREYTASEIANKGSPPYTWGAHRPLCPSVARRRITPIYMGSTLNYNFANGTIKDHPHIHGEHSCVVISRPPYAGSPPYTWGAPSS